MSKVFITDYISDPAIEKEVLENNLCLGSDKGSVEVLLVWHQKIDREFIDKFPKLKGIIRYGVGVDNIDLEYTASKGILVCNTPDYGTDEVSDTAIAMIMNIARGVSRYDFLCRSYSDDSWQENTLPEIKRTSEYKLGVIGAGRIGSSVLLKAKSLRLQTAFYDPYKPRGHEKTLNANRFDDLKEMLRDSDIISVNAPSTAETKGMIDENFLCQMKNGASLVNTSRGDLIQNLDDIFYKLKDDKLCSVALDVLPDEPPDWNSKLIQSWVNRELWLEGRLVINPHSSYFSSQSYYEMRSKAAHNAKRIINSITPHNVITLS